VGAAAQSPGVPDWCRRFLFLTGLLAVAGLGVGALAVLWRGHLLSVYTP